MRPAPKPRLTPEQIDEMFELRKGGMTYENIAAKFDVQACTATKYVKIQQAKEDEKAKKEDNLRVLETLQKSQVPAQTSPPQASRPIPHIGQPEKEFDPLLTQLVNNPIISDGVSQTYREDLLWAIEAAGTKLRTGNRPNSCPNDKAFFLYQQACENPKDFMTKFSQVETKEKDDGDKKVFKKSTEFLLMEIETQLEVLEENL